MSEEEILYWSKTSLEILKREAWRRYSRLRDILDDYDRYIRFADISLDMLKLKKFSPFTRKELYKAQIDTETYYDIEKTLIRLITGLVSPFREEIDIEDLDPELQEKIKKIDKEVASLSEIANKIFDVYGGFVSKIVDIRDDLREKINRGLYDEFLIKYFLEHE